MDKEILVGKPVELGQQLLERLARAGVNVAAACWLKTAERERWQLFVATDLVEKHSLIKALQAVFPEVRALRSPWLDDADVRVVGATHPLVKEVHEGFRQYPSQEPIYAYPHVFCGIVIQEPALLYPPALNPDPQTSTATLQP